MSPKEQHDRAVAERPDVLPGKTYKIKAVTERGDITLYLTICDHFGVPFEIFVNSKNAELVEHMSVLTVFVSRMLRAGMPVEDIAADLEEIHSPFTGHLVPGSGWCASLYARIGQQLLLHARQSTNRTVDV
jgi:hypothetical protein